MGVEEIRMEAVIEMRKKSVARATDRHETQTGDIYILEDSIKSAMSGDVLLARIRQYKGKIDLEINLDEMRSR